MSLFKPHPFLPFSLEPTASWLSSLLRLLLSLPPVPSTGSDPLLIDLSAPSAFDKFLIPCFVVVSLLLFLLFLMRNFKHTKVRKMIA